MSALKTKRAKEIDTTLDACSDLLQVSKSMIRCNGNSNPELVGLWAKTIITSVTRIQEITKSEIEAFKKEVS